VVRALGMPVFEMSGWEADDLIGTLAKQAGEKKGVEVMIVTGDMDMFQLIDDEKVKVFMPGRTKKPSKIYGEDDVAGKLGVVKDRVVDYKGLAGDSSDNIPGIKGIGPKTAIELISRFGSIDGVYRKIDEVLEESAKPSRLARSSKTRATLSETQAGDKLDGEILSSLSKELGFGKSVVKKLVEGREMALLSRELATIKTDAPIKFDLEACRVSGYDKEDALKLFESLGFKSLKYRLPEDEFENDVQEALF